MCVRGCVGGMTQSVPVCVWGEMTQDVPVCGVGMTQDVSVCGGDDSRCVCRCFVVHSCQSQHYQLCDV